MSMDCYICYRCFASHRYNVLVFYQIFLLGKMITLLF